MDIRIRRVITLGFFLFFFIVSPLLLLYSSGYRYDFKRGALLRTGNIFLEAKDIRDAKITIDNKPYKELLNKKLFLKNLLPGEYTIRIEKDGYYTWEKKLRVEGTLTTFVKDVALFLKSEPTELIRGEISTYALSPDQNFIALSRSIGSAHEVWLYNILYEEENLLYRSSEPTSPKLLWAKSSNRLMIVLEDSALVYQTSVTPAALLRELPVAKGQKIQWDAESDSLIYQLSSTEIIRNDLVTRKDEVIFAAASGEQVTDAKITNGTSLLAIIEQGGQTRAQAIDNTLKLSKELFAVSGAGYSIIEDSPLYLVLGNRNTHKLYLIRKNSLTSKDILAQDSITLSGNEAVFSPDKSSLLIINDFEVSTLSLQDRTIRLINRFGQPIIKATWYNDGQHVLLATNTQLMVSDLNTESQKTALVTLMSAANITGIDLLKSDTCLIQASLEDAATLYSIKLK